MTVEPVPQWVPAFPGQRPPFAPGNRLSLTHGAHSRPLVEPRAKALVETIEAAAPPWLQDCDAAAVRGWATAEARCELLRDWLAARDPLNGKGEPWPASTELLRWERLAAQHRQRLGLDPLSRGQLGRDTAVAGLAAAELRASIRGDGQRPQPDDGTPDA